MRAPPRYCLCLDCGQEYRANNVHQRRCTPCRIGGYGAKLRVSARNAVARAVAAGKLVRLAEVHVACVDCGARATRYDHRDYTQPLRVDPVCHPCDRARGSVPCPMPEAA